jgi:hypothetical protein
MKNIMIMKFLFYLTFIYLFKISASEENSKNWKLDGFMLEINSNELDLLMKKIDHSIIFLYRHSDVSKDNLSSEKYFEIYSKIQQAAERLVKFEPAVGVFKINCEDIENLNVCKRLVKNKYSDSKFNDSLPSLIYYNSNKQVEVLENDLKSEYLIFKVENLIKTFFSNLNKNSNDNFSYIIPYDNENPEFKKIYMEEKKNHFVLLINLNSTSSFDENNSTYFLTKYNIIAKKFLEEGVHDLKFTYLDVNKINEKEEVEQDLPLLFFYESYTTDSGSHHFKEKYFFNKNEIKFEILFNFTKNKNNFQNEFSKLKRNLTEKKLGLIKFDEKYLFSNHLIILFYKNFTNLENNKALKKWTFLLEKANYYLNYDDISIPIFKYEIPSNLNLENYTISKKLKLPDTVNSQKQNITIVFYSNNERNNKFNYFIYNKGPSIELFINFINRNSFETEYQLTEEQKKEYFQELFYNQDLMDLDEIPNSEPEQNENSILEESIENFESNFEEGEDTHEEEQSELMNLINNNNSNAKPEKNEL